MAINSYRSRLILVDGITGSGKSTTAQFICQQLEASGIKAKWYHEEEPGHPLESRFDVEHLQGEAEIEGFCEETPELWRRFAEMAQSDDRVHIIESYLLQDTARVLFQNNVDRGRITQLIKQILQSVTPLNPALVYFWQQDAAASLRRIWERRGERWAKWCIETDASAPYSQTVAGSNEEKAIALWRDYQAYANELVAGLTIPKLCIENTTPDWQRYQQQIADFLGLGLHTGSAEIDADIYGTYSTVVGDRQPQCTVAHDGERLCLLSNFLWPKMWLQPQGKDVLLIESLPLSLRCLRNPAGKVVAIRLEGVSRWDGCVLQRKDRQP